MRYSHAVRRIGVISDTHGLVRPEALDALRGVEVILHAGDIGSAAVLEALKTLAPTVAVCGNNDRGPWANALPAQATVEIGAARLLLVHDLSTICVDVVAAGFSGVVAGHSHKPRCERVERVLYFNPGSAGPRRFKLPVCVGILEVQGAQVSGTLVQL